jgi:hypothetical protein
MVVERRVRRMATVEGTLVLPLTGPFTQPPRIVQFDDPFKIIEVDSGHRGAAMDETGRFVFTNVQPGKHRVCAHDGMRWAIADIETSGEKVGNLVLTPQAGSRVTGRLVLDSNAPPRDVSTFAVHLWAQANLNFLAFEPFPFSIDINGHFVFQGIPPGPSALDYFKDSSADLWRMESAVVGGVDALDFPFKVTTGEDVLDLVATLTDKRTRLTGVVLAEDGQPSAGPVVVAFPPDSRYWVPDARRVRLAQSDSKGRFAFPDLPAGDYLIAAIPNSSRDADWDPSLLARLRPAGIAVHLATGDSKFVEVQVR